MSVNYREPQWLLPNEKNLQYPEAGATYGSGLTADRHSLYSMDFDGSSYISAGNPTALQFTDSFSISGWFKSSSSSSSAIVSKDANASGRCYLVQLNSLSPGTLRFRIFVSNVSVTIDHGTGLNDNNWHHFVCVYEKGVGISLYIDNGTPGFTATTGTIDNDAVDFNIGRRGDGLNYFDGQIDEVALWSRALSTSEISTLYNNGAPSNPMLLSGKPVAYYPLGEQARKPGTAEWRFPNEVLESQLIYFDGNTDYINLDSAVNLGVNSTISFWYKTSSNNQGLVPFGGASGPYYYVVQWGSAVNKVYFRVGGTVQEFTGITEIQDGNWHHYCITRTGADAELFVDGVSRGTLTGLPATTDTLIDVIGATSNGTSAINNSYLTQVAFWDSNQSANIANIYNYGAPQTSYTVTPTAWYKLDKTSEYAGLNANWHNALSFSGSNQYIDCGNDTSLQITSDLTVSAWIKTTTSGNRIVLGKADAINTADRSWLMYINSGTTDLRVFMYDTSATLFYVISPSAINDGNWHHVAFTYTPSTSLILYIDGEAVDTNTSSIPASLKNSAENFFIGKWGNYSAEMFPGEISNVAIYNQTISAEDIKYLYNGGTPQTNISFEPVSWWKLDNLTTGIQDSGSASNNGTATGPPTVVTDSVAVDQWNFDNAVQSQTPNWNSALSFDSASSNYITVDNSSGDFSFGTSPFSISLWFNGESFPGAYTALLGSHGSGSNSSFWAVYAHDTVGVVIFHGGQLIGGGGSISTNQWYHYAVTRDSAGNLITYLNGAVVNTATGKTGTFNSSSAIRIGDDLHNANPSFNGKLSNVAIFNAALDSTAIQALYNNGQPETAISSSPVSWYKLDNTTTGIQDSGSASNNGTNNGATEIQTNVWTPRLNAESSTLPSSALTSSDLQFNSAYSSFSLDFDGTNDYVDCGSPSIFDNLNSLSVSCWFNSNLKSQDRGILGKWLSGTDRSFALNLETSGNIRFVVRNSSQTAASTYINTSDWSTGNWYNIIGTYDGTNVKVYLNGVLKDTASLTGTVLNTTHPFRIGKYHSTTAPFSGKIDETAVWNRALNQAEITSIYNNGYPKDITALAPISWWRLGEDAYFDGTDFTIPNKISGAPNGTSDNMTATDLVADAPGSYAAGLGSSLALADRVGNAALSTANSLSFNMTPVNRVSYPAGYVPTQVDNVYSMDFDGTNDYINAGDLSILSEATAVSVSLWFNRDTTTNQFLLDLKDGSSRIGLQLYLNNSIYFYVNNKSYFHSTSPSINQWYNLVYVFNGAGASNADKLKMYLNGTELTGGTYSGTIDSAIGAFTSSMTSNIGRIPSTSYFNGQIDEVAIFDYALSARQIKQDIYNGTTSGKTADLNNISNLTPPVAWYRMGD